MSKAGNVLHLSLAKKKRKIKIRSLKSLLLSKGFERGLKPSLVSEGFQRALKSLPVLERCWRV